MKNQKLKNYIILIFLSVSWLLITFLSIVKFKYDYGMKDVSYKYFLFNSILYDFNLFWLIVIVTTIFSVSAIIFSFKRIYLLKNNKNDCKF